VLVDQGTASAAEIVAGALQDAGRATVVGETTFGTGTVLQEFPLSDGSVLLLAVEEWLTPKGRVIWHQGLDPDVTVALPSDVEPLQPLTERDLTAAQLRDSGDAQLLRALDLLAGASGD
jgi:carboxyl-terminal processing protease